MVQGMRVACKGYVHIRIYVTEIASLLYESRIIFLLKIEQVLQKVDEGRLFQDVLLC